MKHDAFPISRRYMLAGSGALIGTSTLPAFAAEPQIASQPYFASVKRAMEAMATIGQPIARADTDQLANLAAKSDLAAVAAAEAILDRYTLVRITTEADGYAQVAPGGAERTLIEQGWRAFLVRVANPLGITKKVTVQGQDSYVSWSTTGASRTGVPDTDIMAPMLEKTWLASEMLDHPSIRPELSGTPLEYKIIQLYARDRGRHGTIISAFTTDYSAGSNAWFAKQTRRGRLLDFNCLPSSDVELSVLDMDGKGCVASLIIKDDHGRIYPFQGRRLAPDFYFQRQIYRADGETVRLSDGQYNVESWRGPEYLVERQLVQIGAAQRKIEVRLQRWINPANWGWYSGDVHIHASGCAHYANPTEGVTPETMIRHVRGEGLYIGEVLTWGPAWYYQKQFFTGQAASPEAALEHPELQAANHTSLKPKATPKDHESMLRYDVEVSGFPSSVHGHLVLLRLKEQDYPGTKIIQDWPSWNLPILKWAREQGAVAGYAHCGHGMVVDSTDLPNYEIPPMDGIGTQEAIVDVTHGLCDFLAGCDTHPAAELNAWYHMLNCGFRLTLPGETDYPCVTGERPGFGRSYVQLDRAPVDDTGYNAWVDALKKGRLYSGDGRSHLLEFKVERKSAGADDVMLSTARTVKVTALVAARLDPERTKEMEDYLSPPELERTQTWHLERARIAKTRTVPVELIVNGIAVDRTVIVADGSLHRINFKTAINRSSWVALRILPSSHSSPIFVTIDNKPVRASKRSAEWCRACVDKLWEEKHAFIREHERPAAAEAYDHARKTYDRIIAESEIA